MSTSTININYLLAILLLLEVSYFLIDIPSSYYYLLYFGNKIFKIII